MRSAISVVEIFGFSDTKRYIFLWAFRNSFRSFVHSFPSFVNSFRSFVNCRKSDLFPCGNHRQPVPQGEPKVARSEVVIFKTLRFQHAVLADILQHGHLLNSNLIEFVEAFLLRHAFVDKKRIQVLHIT